MQLLDLLNHSCLKHSLFKKVSKLDNNKEDSDKQAPTQLQHSLLMKLSKPNDDKEKERQWQTSTCSAAAVSTQHSLLVKVSKFNGKKEKERQWQTSTCSAAAVMSSFRPSLMLDSTLLSCCR
eukprot:1149731-Pelagomonas_calceolata.AAC.5